MACQRNFDSRVSYKRRDLFPLLYRVFKQISLQKLPTCFQWDSCNVKGNKEEIQENIDSLETAEVESFTKVFQKTKKPSNLTYRNLVAKKSEKPRASRTKWYGDCDLNEEEIDWKKNISAHENRHKIIFQF